jgi:hypothetical protein
MGSDLQKRLAGNVIAGGGGGNVLAQRYTGNNAALGGRRWASIIQNHISAPIDFEGL